MTTNDSGQTTQRHRAPPWVDPTKGQPTLMLFSVVDDRSGVCYMEYRCVYGEDAESALRFLFSAMAPKIGGFPFQGRPKMLYLDNGPVAKSRVFQNVMTALGVDWQTHIPAGKDGERVTARSKGKVERPFRTVKEAHEALYHAGRAAERDAVPQPGPGPRDHRGLDPRLQHRATAFLARLRHPGGLRRRPRTATGCSAPRRQWLRGAEQPVASPAQMRNNQERSLVPVG
jgi:hypothetical protein